MHLITTPNYALLLSIRFSERHDLKVESNEMYRAETFTTNIFVLMFKFIPCGYNKDVLIIVDLHNIKSFHQNRTLYKGKSEGKDNFEIMRSNQQGNSDVRHDAFA